MNLGKRFLFYGSGFAMGMVLLIFFLGGKRASCNYWPEARVLGDIAKKSILLNDETRAALSNRELDTTEVMKIIRYGDVDFSLSDTDAKPCNIYHINGKKELEEVAIKVQNCREHARVIEIIDNRNKD